MGKKVDYADVYFEYRKNEGVSLEEGLVKSCSQSTANGVGVRVFGLSGEVEVNLHAAGISTVFALRQRRSKS